MSAPVELSTEEKLSQVELIWHCIDAIIPCVYDKLNGDGGKSDRDHAYALVMALERLSDEIGRITGVI